MAPTAATPEGAPGREQGQGRGDGRPQQGSRGSLRVNWVAFIATGVVLGFLAGGLLHLLGPAADMRGTTYGAGTSVLFLAAFGSLIGGLVGALAGVVADVVLARR